MYKKTLLLSTLAIAAVGCSSEKEKSKQSSKPNVLIIVADDLGFSDIEPFGGNISTPSITAIAKNGIKFSNFHVQPTCSPSRSSLLTGNDNHVAGLGIMSELDYPELHNKQLTGYSGKLSNQVVTIPEILRENGYHTYMVGKWHLGEGKGYDPFDRGFEETFILGTGGGSHYNNYKALAPLQKMEFTRNGSVVGLPDDFYSSKNYTDSMIAFIDKNADDGKPFFAYLSYTAVHDPLQVPQDYISKYKGKFDMGWDSLWSLRFHNLKALGIIPAAMKAQKNPAIPQWGKLPPAARAAFAKDMEVYAGMLEYMDMSIGRVIEYLKKRNLYDNTLIVFMSDNGANGAMATTYPGNEDGSYLSTFNNANNNKGLINSYVEMGPGWAQASSSPFRFYKTFATEGGIKAPLIVKPAKSKSINQNWISSFVHVTDIMPTILELAGAAYPSNYKGNTIHPMIGKSLNPILKGDSTSIHTNDGYGWELFEMKAYIKGDYKLLRLPIPFGTGKWQLYNLKTDPGESIDLSDQLPQIKAELLKEWERYAQNNQVYDHKGHFDTLYQQKLRPEHHDD